MGGGFAIGEMPAHVDGLNHVTPARFNAGPGFHLDISWQVLKYLRFTGYMSEHDHSLQFPAGSLDIPCACIQGQDAHMYDFGFRFSPTLPLGKHVRLWLTGGLGWGRIEYPRYAVSGPSPYTIPDRAESLFELPLGLGGSVEIIPRWLSLRVEATGAFLPSQIGDALGPTQAINAGLMMKVGPMPQPDAYFLQTIGLSLHL